MNSNLETLREILVVVLDILKRRWKLFLLPPLIALVLGTIAMRTAPTKYTASSLIMLQGANRAPNAAGWQPNVSPADQLGALDAWLKSDQVLEGLLPAIMDGGMPADIRERHAAINALRASLSLELVGGGVLDIRLVGSRPEGLGRKLEVIVARLLEALVGPDRGLFNASQFVITARSDAVKRADDALARYIADLPSQPPEGVRTKLRQLAELQSQSARLSAQPGVPAAEAITKLRQEISPDDAVVTELERLFAIQQAAKIALDATTSASGPRAAYVGIFAAPENLVVIGRPQDPLAGQNSAMKLVIAGLLLSILIGAALVLAIEILNGRLRMRREFETATGLPVLARLPNITGRI